MKIRILCLLILLPAYLLGAGTGFAAAKIDRDGEGKTEKAVLLPTVSPDHLKAILDAKMITSPKELDAILSGEKTLVWNSSIHPYAGFVETLKHLNEIEGKRLDDPQAPGRVALKLQGLDAETIPGIAGHLGFVGSLDISGNVLHYMRVTTTLIRPAQRLVSLNMSHTWLRGMPHSSLKCNAV